MLVLGTTKQNLVRPTSELVILVRKERVQFPDEEIL